MYMYQHRQLTHGVHPLLFHTYFTPKINLAQTSLFYLRIMYDRLLEYIIFYRMHLHLVNPFLHLRGWSTMYNVILHVVLYHVKNLYFTI